MTIVLATIATLLLLIPGFAFIAGANLSDKNIREIVFRNTPAELAYVIVISLVVHFVFIAIPPAILPATSRFIIDPAHVFERDFGASAAHTGSSPVSVPDIVLNALLYTIASGFVGGALGYALGTIVRVFELSFFVKHRWMLELATRRKGFIVFAQLLMAEKFSPAKDQSDAIIVFDGTVSDCYFSADGSLLYLVLSSFRETVVELGKPPLVAVPQDSGVSGVRPEPAPDTSGRLWIDGRQVAAVRYERVEAGKIGGIQERDLLGLRQAAAAREADLAAQKAGSTFISPNDGSTTGMPLQDTIR
jgi:hypothetical protein